MAARDVLAAVLIAAGITALTLAAFLISAPAGFGVLGGLLLALGVAVGFGEREAPQGLLAEEPALSGPAPEAFPAEIPFTADVASVTDSADLQSLVPLANYLGRTARPPVEVPRPEVLPEVPRP